MADKILDWIPVLNEKLGGFARPVVTIAVIAIIVAAALILSKILTKITERAFEGTIKRGKSKKDPKRIRTVKAVIKYLINIIIWFLAAVAIIDTLGFTNTVWSLLATAGIGGIAIGFGAQTLIKDILNGIFIILEGQIEIGDFITVGDYSGEVEDIQLRTTKIRSLTGELYIVPNGSISVVVNHSRGNVLAMVDIPMPYEENIGDVEALLQRAMNEYAENSSFVKSAPEVAGVDNLADSAVIIKIIAEVRRADKVPAEREIRQYAVEALERAGISVPYNKIEVINK